MSLVESTMQIEQGQYNARWLCAYCGDDFRAWLQIAGEDWREFLRRRPYYDITRLLEHRCPRCSYPYRSEEA